jgi:5'-nucleotidase
MKTYRLLLLFCLFFVYRIAGAVSFTLLQLNDVYEIAPLNAGKTGGLARVATLKKQLLAENPHTYSVLAGDLLSPSAIGTAVINGKPLAGKQMIALFNQLNWDYATFGNHEFDIGRTALLERLSEANTVFFSSNVIDHTTQKPFLKSQQTVVFNVDTVKVGLVGITLPELKQDFVDILDPFSRANSAILQLKQQGVHFIILVTHQDLASDIKFAEKFPDVDLIIGGHEHENSYLFRGQKLIPITKADANAKSAFVHYLNFDEQTGKKTITSKLVFLDESVALDEETTQLVNQWQEEAFKLYRQQGFEPDRIVCRTDEALDGLEASVRNQTTRLTEILAQAYLKAYPAADVSLYNSGSIRIDDIIQPGNITEYDVIKILPFSGRLNLVQMTGELLQKALATNSSLQGKGSFLHYANISYQQGRWFVGKQLLELHKNYKVAIPDFLIEKGDLGLDFLKLSSGAGIKVISDVKVEVRKALIQELSLRL